MVSAVAILLMLVAGIQRAGATTVTTYPPVTDPPASTVVVIPDGDDDRVEVGESVELIADGWEPGTEVFFYVLVDGEKVLIGSAIADENGDAIFDWTIPAGVCCGDFDIEIEGIDEETGEPRTAVAAVFVYEFGAGVPGDGGELPYTGSNSTSIVRIGLVLLVAGGVSVFAVRRRSARAAS
jgi:LPXTG-motif cell wall-anchored protein